MIRLEFDTPPATLRPLVRAMLQRRPGLAPGETLPRVEAAIRRVAPEPERVARYRTLCGFTNRDSLPITYPHLLGSPLHLHMAAVPGFPLPAMGMVHVRNLIVQHRSVGIDEVLSVTCHVEGHREVDRGVEFDAHTRVDSGDERVWESVSTVLVRTATKRSGTVPRRRHEPPPEPGHRVEEQLPAGLGRRYTRVSHDFNPIHLSRWSAKLFGFRRAIIHGMWSLARCAAELEADLPEHPVRLEVAFKTPVFLPTGVGIEWTRAEDGIDFELRSIDRRRLHLGGRLAAHRG